MSLHALAGHMATKGRSGDSMLVHMTPEEVQSLQAMALKGGGSLTINPDTGLPEANFLKSILPIVAGFALGPAGFGLMSAGMAGAAVGGITALSTGSLSRGLMAGLGAYGGASLGAGLAGAGVGAAQEAAMAGVGEGASQAALNEAAAKATTDFMGKGVVDRLTEGAGAAFSDPKAFVQGMGGMGKLAQTGLMAISPMMADKGVQTTTPQQDTGNIRRFSFDRYGQTYTPQGVFPAEGYTGMAQGGIVALAAGGVSDADIQGWMAANKGADDKTIASAMQEYGVSAGQLSSAMGYNPQEVEQRYAAATAPAGFTNYSQAEIGNYLAANPNANIAAATQQFNADPRAVNQYIVGLTQNYADPSQTQRGTGTSGYYDALSQYGIDANELFAANQGLTPGYNFVGDTTAGQMTRAYDVAGEFKGFDPQVGNQVANDIEWVKKMDETGRGAVDIARLTGLSIGEVQAREAAARDAMKKVVARPIVPGPIDKVPYVPDGVSGGGNTVVNKNGTITTTPNIPGRPEGGFTGMGQVRDAYTAGGGSLGYVNPAPKTMEEFNTRFNKQTGDSLAAYEYLMGKGANPATQQRVGEIARPYNEAIVGIPAAEGRPNQKYIYENGKYVENPNYAPVTYDSKGNRVTGSSSAQAKLGFGVLKPAQTQANFDYVSYLKNNPEVQAELDQGIANFGNKNNLADAAYNHYTRYGEGDGRTFTTIPGAKPADNDVFAWADTNNVSDAQLVPLMGITLAEVVSRRAKYKKPEAGANTNNNTNNNTNDGGGDGPGPGPGPGSAVSAADAAADAAAAAADGAAAAAGVGTGPGTGAGHAYGGQVRRMALGGLGALAGGGSTSQYNLGGYSDGGRLLRGPGDGVSDSIPATIGDKQPARLADGEFVVPARIVSELGNGSTEAGARKLYAMMDRVQKARGKTTGKSRVAANTRAEQHLPA